MKIAILSACIVATGISSLVVPAVLRTQRACGVVESFVLHVQQKNWSEAKTMLDTDPSWVRIQDGKVLYFDQYDITDKVATASPRFWKTFEYYLTDRSMGDKVMIFGGYARLKDGKIIRIKIP